MFRKKLIHMTRPFTVADREQFRIFEETFHDLQMVTIEGSDSSFVWGLGDGHCALDAFVTRGEVKRFEAAGWSRVR